MTTITIGRDRTNTIIIPDPYVGRNHCQIVRHDNGTFTIADFGSTNGTYVNGVRRYGETALQPNDQVRIGNTMLPWMGYFNRYGNYPNTFQSNPPQYISGSVQKRKPPILGIISLSHAVIGIHPYLLMTFFTSIAALICGIIATFRKEKAFGLGLAGLITGAVEIILGIVVWVFVGTTGFLY